MDPFDLEEFNRMHVHHRFQIDKPSPENMPSTIIQVIFWGYEDGSNFLKRTVRLQSIH